MRRDLPRALLWLSSAVWAAGFVLSAATIAGSTGVEIAATAFLMPAFVVYAVLIGQWLHREAAG